MTNYIIINGRWNKESIKKILNNDITPINMETIQYGLKCTKFMILMLSVHMHILCKFTMTSD